ncbi:serine protease gd-like [Chironomus tepperi]|uniref:serine protease gd-like n=1 Tax=Chironomus tepperi TaxID=113505 RepID=UPI00391EF10A
MSYSAYILVFVLTILMSINEQSTAATPTCGKSMSGRGNVVGGKFASRGEHPWNVALVSPSGEYFCGATLVSTRKVITTAHCIQDKFESKPRLPSSFIALLGVYNLNNSLEIGRTANAIQSVTVHPDWDTISSSFDADIAVLVLETEVVFNEFIQPACIIIPGTDVVAVTTGIIIGYGHSEDTTKIQENIPKVLEMPIHTNEDCFMKFPSLERQSSERTFCAGFDNGVGACRGDNGNGLFVTDGNAYYLRGILSVVIINGYNGCDVIDFSILTDVTKYIDWIVRVSVE